MSQSGEGGRGEGRAGYARPGSAKSLPDQQVSGARFAFGKEGGKSFRVSWPGLLALFHTRTHTHNTETPCGGPWLVQVVKSFVVNCLANSQSMMNPTCMTIMAVDLMGHSIWTMVHEF